MNFIESRLFSVARNSATMVLYVQGGPKK